MNTKTVSITEYDDIIDSRDLISAIERLREERDEAPGEFDHAELEAMESFAAEAFQYCEDWHYGAVLIRYSHFTDYVKELLVDCGDIPKNLPHYVRIDWEATAREIRADYTSVTFGTTTYWVR